MNAQINKVIDHIERTKAKIAELQALLPELERKRVDMENTEIIKLVRSADISIAGFPEFVRSIEATRLAVPKYVADTEEAASTEDTQFSAQDNSSEEPEGDIDSGEALDLDEVTGEDADGGSIEPVHFEGCQTTHDASQNNAERLT